MAHRTKLFRSGGSQAVRLPGDCRFPDDQTEVIIRREGRRVIVEPVVVWPEEFLARMGAWKEPLERPQQLPRSGRRDPFGPRPVT